MADTKSAQQSAGVVYDPIQHPGWGATIETVAQFFVQAQFGTVSGWVDLIDDTIRRDPTISNLVNARVSGITKATPEIVPADQSPEAIELADKFRARWDALDSFSAIAHHQRDPLSYGWAASEIIWAVDSDTGEAYPADLIHPRARTYQIAGMFNIHAKGTKPDEILVRTGPYMGQNARMIPFKWIESRERPSAPAVCGGNGYATALYGVLKANNIAGWSVFIDRFGLPFVQATIDSWTDGAAVAVAKRALESIGSDNGIIIGKNDGLTIEAIDAVSASRSANSDIHGRYNTNANAELTKLWSGGSLTSEGGSSGATFALGREHASIRFELLESDAKRIQSVFDRDLIGAWMHLNEFDAPPPKLQLRFQRVSDPQTLVSIVKELAGVGYKVDPVQIQQLTGLRRSDEE